MRDRVAKPRAQFTLFGSFDYAVSLPDTFCIIGIALG